MFQERLGWKSALLGKAMTDSHGYISRWSIFVFRPRITRIVTQSIGHRCWSVGLGLRLGGTYNIGIRKWYKKPPSFTLACPLLERHCGRGGGGMPVFWQLRFMAQSARQASPVKQQRKQGLIFCPLVIAKVRKKVDTNWGQPLISHTRAKLTFGSSA